jgi:hypothetical protein
MKRARLAWVGSVVVLAVLLLGAGMPALVQGSGSPSPSAPAASGSPSGGITNLGPSATDPVATVNTLLDVVIGRRFDQITSYACAASAADLDSHLNFETLFANSMPAGTDGPGLIDTMTLSIPDRSVTSVSTNGDTATVHVSGSLVIGVDEAALRPWVKQLLVTAGEDSSDPSVDTNIASIVKQLAVSIDITRDVTLTMDGGYWLICDASPGASPSP